MSILYASLLALMALSLTAAAVFILRGRSRGGVSFIQGLIARGRQVLPQRRPGGNPAAAEEQPSYPGQVMEAVLMSQTGHAAAQESLAEQGEREDQPNPEAVGQTQDLLGREEEEEEKAEEEKDSLEEEGLLSLFRTEEVGDLDLQALTQELEDIDAQDLLRECKDIASQLKGRRRPSRPAP